MKRIVWIVGLGTILVGVAWVINLAGKIKANASTAEINEEVDNLFAGLQTYKENIGTYPVGSNAEIVKALMGQNPKRMIIQVGRKNELNEKGQFIDPWGTAFRVYFSKDGILVRSAGPNRRFDDSTALDNDDYYRSN